MKFENPIMTISMFEVENIVTESGPAPTDPTPGPQQANVAAHAAIANQTYTVVF